MTEAQSISAKYIFLDIVSYSHGRSVEAQTEIISVLNAVVRDSVKHLSVADEQVIYLPTGDGICIALLGVEHPYDIHVLLALEILKRLETHNVSTVDQMRNFQIRIGLNANVDNLVTDINGKRNVAGAGINLAQRVMNSADGSQILVGESVHETLRYREKYMNVFKSFTATAKHGIQLRVHQLVGRSSGLDISEPSQFKAQETTEPRLTKLAAYYFAQAILNGEFLKATMREHGWGQGTYTATVLLYMLAHDSSEASSALDLNPHDPRIWGAGKATLAEQFAHYDAMEFAVISELAGFIYARHLAKFSNYFDSSIWGDEDCLFVAKEGREKLKREWPKIWEEFGFKTTL